MGKEVVSPLRQRMIEDMNARKLGKHSQRSHIHSCKRFAAFLKRSPETATPDDIRRFQLHLIESGLSICNRNRIMTGVKFLVRVTLRRLDLAAEIYHLREPQKIPQVMSPDETRRLLAVASSLKVRVLLSLGYGCGLRAGEVAGTLMRRGFATHLLYPPFLRAVGTIPIGYPEKDVSKRYRRPLEKIVHWNRYDATKPRPDAMIEHYVTEVRPFAMYRGLENIDEWEDADEILGNWRDFYVRS